MKRDIRKQTFSKPVRPDEEEIKRLTSDETENSSSEREITGEKKVGAKKGSTAPKKNVSIGKSKLSNQNDKVSTGNLNPFLLSRGQASEIGIEKTGYRLRSDYMDLLKLVKRMKKGYTLEAILDDVLTYYFENSDDGRKAVKQRAILDAD